MPDPQRHRPATALGVLSGLNVLNYVDRFVAAAVLPLIIASLHITDTQAGLLQTVFILVYALVSPAAGWLGDSRRRLPIAAVGVILWSAATFSSGLASTFAMLLMARALVGVGEASYSVVAPSVISDLYPAQRRGRAMAVFYAAIPLGSACGYVLGGALGATLGWRSTFMIVGGPGALLGVALLFLREPQRGRFDPPSTAPATSAALGPSLRALASRRSYLFNTVGQTLYTFSTGGLAYWMPTYFFRERGIPLATAATTFGGLLALAGFAATLLGGQLGDRLAPRIRGSHFAVAGAGLLASVPFTVVAVLAASPAVFWPAMFVSLLLIFLNTGPLNAAMANSLPADLRARGFAISTMSIHLFGDALSPTLIGAASDRVGLAWPVLATGALLGVAGLVLIAGRAALERDMVRAT